MTIAHFAGVNTSQIAAAAEGHPVLISYASMLDGHGGVIDREVLPRLRAGKYGPAILDSGAFTVMSKGITVPIEDYIAYALKHGHLFSQVITLDDIGGDLAVTWRNTKKMIDAGLNPVPVFHGREPWAVLRHYCETFGSIGLGFYREKRGKRVMIATDQGDGLSPEAWLSKALDIAAEYGTAVHGFGMVRYARVLGHTRLATSDSTSWNAEYKALRSRSIKGSDRLGDGDAATLLGPLLDTDLMRVALASYNGTGPDAGTLAIVADSCGQAKTVLSRFNSGELYELLATFEREWRSTRRAIRG